MQQESFNFFLFSAKRGGASPNTGEAAMLAWSTREYRLSGGIFPPFTEYLGACISRWTEVCWWESGWRHDVAHGQVFPPPWVIAVWMMHKKPCCDYIHMEKPWRWQQRILIVRLYSTIIEKSWIFSQKFLRHIIVTKTPGWFPFPQGGRSMIKLNASLWKMMTDGVDDKYHEIVVQILSYILMYSYASRWPPW